MVESFFFFFVTLFVCFSLQGPRVSLQAVMNAIPVDTNDAQISNVVVEFLRYCNRLY